MAAAQLRTVIKHLHQMVTRGRSGDLTDADMLQRFAIQRDEAAFEVLVWRHGGMVLDVCRRILPGEQDAEDAFQTTFLTLVREASSVRKHHSIGSWLYKVAYRVALKAKARAARRAVAERQACCAPGSATEQDLITSRDLRPVLDEEVNRLPEKYRVAFVLCYLQGLTNEAAAQQLGWPKGTVVTRLAWARERLRGRLTRRGLAPSAALLSACLASNVATASLPADLVLGTVRTGLHLIGGTVGANAVSIEVAGLLNETAKGVLFAKGKVTAALILGVAFLAGSGLLAYRQLAPRANNSPQEPAQQVNAGTEAKVLRGRVIDKISGAGIRDVKLVAYHVTDQNTLIDVVHATTDAEGRFAASVKPGSLNVQVTQTPTAYLVPVPENDPRKRNPGADDTSFTITLERAARLTGTVVNESGKPLQGAELRVIKPSYSVYREPKTAPSNAAGAFEVVQLDPQDPVPLRARDALGVTDGAIVITPAEVKQPLRLVVSAKNAFRLRGRIIDDAGRPVHGAKVNLIWHVNYVSKRIHLTSQSERLEDYVTDADGRFESKALWPGDRYCVEVAAEGHARSQSIPVLGRRGETHDLGQITLLQSKRRIEGTVMDSAGKPVPDVRVFSAGSENEPTNARTDARGRFVLANMRSGPAFVCAEKEGWKLTAARVPAGSEQVTISFLRADETRRREPGEHNPALGDQPKLARSLLEQLWAQPGVPRSRDASRYIKAIAALDTALGLGWSRQNGGGYTYLVHTAAARRLAETDPPAALAQLAAMDDDRACWTARALAAHFLTADPVRALGFTAELARRAAKLRTPEKIRHLARAGGLLLKLHQDETGRKMINDAAEAAGKLDSADRWALSSRAAVAEALASYDSKRALEMLSPCINTEHYQSAAANLAIAMAPHDFEQALALVARLPNVNWERDQAKLRIAYELAPTRPGQAVRLVESMNSADARKIQAESLAWLAVAIAPHDKSLACSLIDRSLAIYVHEPEAFRSWSTSGGVSTFAAGVAVLAREIGYPDMDSVVARVLATLQGSRPDFSPADAAGAQIMTALLLALVDPDTSREILESIEPYSHLLATGYSNGKLGHRLQAWALIDLPQAMKLFEKDFGPQKGKPNTDPIQRGWLDLAELLAMPSQDRPRYLIRHLGSMWVPDDDKPL